MSAGVSERQQGMYAGEWVKDAMGVIDIQQRSILGL